MDRYIHLRDCAHIEAPELHKPWRAGGQEFKPESIKAAREALCKRDLYFDNYTGRIHEGGEEVEKHSYAGDFVPHHTERDVFDWEFSRYIRNSASRIERGFKP